MRATEPAEKPSRHPGWRILEDILIVGSIPAIWLAILRRHEPAYRLLTYAAIFVLLVILIRRISRLLRLGRE